MTKKSTFLTFFLIVTLSLKGCTQSTKENNQQEQQKSSLHIVKPTHVRGIHLTSAAAGSVKFRERFTPLLSNDKLNTIVIAVKEYDGVICLPNTSVAKKYNIPTWPIPKLKEYLEELKNRGIYTIARIVVFKDNALATKHPELAVKNPDGSVWHDYKGNCWTDPYNKEVHQYNIEIAKAAVEIGFDEIQFDYIRFPSDGNIKLCRYSQNHSSTTATLALLEFLSAAKQQLSPIPISIDVFGLTPSVNHDMGIGQRFLEMANIVDYISPMTYPSHYRKGEYGIPDPNKEPYNTVFRTISDAKKLLGEQYKKLRPYLQDFSLGYKYGKYEVEQQIKACYNNGIFDWLLWDPKCKYTLEAIEEMVKYNENNWQVTVTTESVITNQLNSPTTNFLDKTSQ